MALQVIQIDTLDDLKEHVKHITSKLRDPLPVQEESEKPTFSPFATELLDIFEKADFGCQAESVGMVLSAIVKNATGETVVFKDEDEDEDEDNHVKFSAVVPIINLNNHSYGIGEVILMRNKTIGMNKAAEPGNNMSREKHTYRYATDEEIDAFFVDASKRLLTAFM